MGSSVDLSYNANVFVSSLPSGSSVTVDVYAYTTLYFRCQTNAGTCPIDPTSTAPPLPISSPFDVFEGVCDTDMNGFYLVCLYAGTSRAMCRYVDVIFFLSPRSISDASVLCLLSLCSRQDCGRGVHQ